MTAGWLFQFAKPTRNELRDFLSKHGVSVGYGNIVGGNLVWGGGSVIAFECGVFSPGWAITWQYDFESPQNSYGPDFYWDPEARVKDRM